jgi:hypothetical protein
MKHVLLIAALFISAIGFAQSNTEDIDLIQSLYGMEKKDIIADFLMLEGTQADGFWSLYDQYEMERKKLGKERIALLQRYAYNYNSLDDATTDSLVKEMTALGAKTDKLISKYYNKMKKPAGVKAAAQFVQIETYLLSVVRASILENIPFIGELD